MRNELCVDSITITIPIAINKKTRIFNLYEFELYIQIGNYYYYYFDNSIIAIRYWILQK